MAAKNGKATPSKGVAARREKKAGRPTLEFRGITLELPETLPGSLYFDFADLADSGGDPAAELRCLRSLIGEEQVRRVREKIEQDGVTFDDLGPMMAKLFEDAFAAYGSTVGESAASPTS